MIMFIDQRTNCVKRIFTYNYLDLDVKQFFDDKKKIKRLQNLRDGCMVFSFLHNYLFICHYTDFGNCECRHRIGLFTPFKIKFQKLNLVYLTYMMSINST